MMFVHLTNIQVIIVGFALILTIVFTLAEFLDIRWRKAAPLRDFGPSHKPNSFLQSLGPDDRDRASDLHTRHADLTARGLGTAEQRIAFRSKRQKNRVGVDPAVVLTKTTEWPSTLAPSRRHSVEPGCSHDAFPMSSESPI